MYKLLNRNGVDFGAVKEENGIRISFAFSDPANTDYQKYLEWLEAGNTPEPADQGEQV